MITDSKGNAVDGHVLRKFVQTSRAGRTGYWIYWNPLGDINHSTDPRSAYIFGVEDAGPSANRHTIHGEWSMIDIDTHMRDLWDQAAEYEALATQIRRRCSIIEDRAKCI